MIKAKGVEIVQLYAKKESCCTSPTHSF